MESDPPNGLAARLAAWSPEPVLVRDDLDPGPAHALSAVADLLPVNDVLPPFWHWLYFLSWPPHEALGPDGHPEQGHFYPPIPDRRRMVAGGRLEVHTPLRLGVTAERESRLATVSVKQGRTGELAFVTVRHVVSQAGTVCLVEEHDLVYRQGSPRGGEVVTLASERPSVDEPWQKLVAPDTRLLFRFSALTANAHRIHYDLPYTREVEGFPALVVHGPWQVLQMLDLVRRHAGDRRVTRVSYRMRSPVFCGEPVVVAGRPDEGAAVLRTATARDARHATAEVTLE